MASYSTGINTGNLSKNYSGTTKTSQNAKSKVNSGSVNTGKNASQTGNKSNINTGASKTGSTTKASTNTSSKASTNTSSNNSTANTVSVSNAVNKGKATSAISSKPTASTSASTKYSSPSSSGTKTNTNTTKATPTAQPTADTIDQAMWDAAWALIEGDTGEEADFDEWQGDDTVKNSGSSYDVESYYQELLDSQASQYAQALAAQKAAIQAGVDQAVNSINAQKTSTADEYADMYRQAYINKMNSEKNINQVLAAQGQTGGAAESTLLGLNTDYSNNLTEGQRNEQKALAALEQAITDAKLSGSIENANAIASNATNEANNYASIYQNMINALQNQYQYEQSQANENRSYNYTMAMQMLQNGIMPSDAVLSESGISKSDAAAIVANVQAAKVKGSNAGASNDIDTSSIYKQTNNYGNSANLATNGIQTKLKSGQTYSDDYFGVKQALTDMINQNAKSSELYAVIDSNEANGVINSAQAKGLKTMVKNS